MEGKWDGRVEDSLTNSAGSPAEYQETVDANPASASWMTKPTDRFVLRWVKVHICSRITPRLTGVAWLQPWMVTLCGGGVGVLGGVVFALGWGWMAGLLILTAQILDGVDGQFARISGRESRAGAFLDSVLDRYADGAMVIGLVIYLLRLPAPVPSWALLALGSLALVGSGLVSYTSARAECLGLSLGPPTMANKGTRTTVSALTGVGSLFWAVLPMVALVYLVIHPNGVVFRRLALAFRSAPSSFPMEGRNSRREMP